MDDEEESLLQLRNRAQYWRCEVTDNLCGTDTRPVNSPCQCHHCVTWQQVMVECVWPYWTEQQIAEIHRMGRRLFEQMNPEGSCE